MANPPLTDVALRKLCPPISGSLEVWDGKIPGFGVRVSPKGTKSFVLLYRHQGRPKRLTMGRPDYPDISVHVLTSAIER